MVEHAGGLFLGGEFVEAGGMASWNVARWDLVPVGVEIEDLEISAEPNGNRVSWRIPASALGELSSILVQRSDAETGPYSDLSPALEPLAGMTYFDPQVEAGQVYWYRLKLSAFNGTDSVSHALSIRASSIQRHAMVLEAFQRPDDGTVQVRFVIGAPGVSYRLAMYDVTGHLVREVATGVSSAGEHVKVWNGRDAAGARVARGVYFARLTTSRANASRKFVRLHD
jgi:hypothetical protein